MRIDDAIIYDFVCLWFHIYMNSYRWGVIFYYYFVSFPNGPQACSKEAPAGSNAIVSSSAYVCPLRHRNRLQCFIKPYQASRPLRSTPLSSSPFLINLFAKLHLARSMQAWLWRVMKAYAWGMLCSQSRAPSLRPSSVNQAEIICNYMSIIWFCFFLFFSKIIWIICGLFVKKCSIFPSRLFGINWNRALFALFEIILDFCKLFVDLIKIVAQFCLKL